MYLRNDDKKCEKLKKTEYLNGDKTWWSMKEKIDVLYQIDGNHYLNATCEKRLFRKTKTGCFTSKMEEFHCPLQNFKPIHPDAMKARISLEQMANHCGLF